MHKSTIAKVVEVGMLRFLIVHTEVLEALARSAKFHDGPAQFQCTQIWSVGIVAIGLLLAQARTHDGTRADIDWRSCSLCCC